ncbi:MAG: DUF58 domain-containing protein [Phycisphaerae bacterium]
MNRSLGFSQRLWRQIRLHNITPGGRVFLWALFVAGVTGMVTLTIPVYHVFAVLMGVYLGIWLVAQFARRRLRAEGRLPRRAVATQPVRCEFRLHNDSKLPAWDVQARVFYLPRAIEQTDGDVTIRRLDPGESAAIPVTLLPRRRGLYPMPPLRSYTTFPFNILRTGRRETPLGSLLVVPHFHPLESIDLAVGPRYQPGGIALTSHVGESPEYIGNRDYRPGDSIRKLDFRSWARLARPVTREYQEEYYCRIALVCDTYVGRRRLGPGGHGPMEAALSLAGAIADALGRGEYVIDIFAAGPELYELRTGRATSELESILEILASVEPCRDNPFSRITPALAEQLERISSVIFVLLDWDESRRELVRRAVEAGCRTKVILVSSRPPSLAVDIDANWAEDFRRIDPEDIQAGRVHQL